MIQNYQSSAKEWSFGWVDWLSSEEDAGRRTAGTNEAPLGVASTVGPSAATAGPSAATPTLLERITTEMRAPEKASRERHFLHENELGHQPDFLGQLRAQYQMRRSSDWVILQ